MTDKETLKEISEYITSIMATNCDKDCKTCCEKKVLADIKAIILENNYDR